MHRNPSGWPDQALTSSQDLHAMLRIDDRSWHRLKSNRDRRCAELLSAALVQLLGDGDRADVQALTEQALGWINGDLKDPGCPHHG